MRASANTKRAVFAVRGMSCTTCALGIEKRLERVKGVESVSAGIMLNQVYVDYDDTKIDLEKVTEEIRKAGYASHVIRKAE
ncbi:MAG: heavy-metal-associated domain-containing protein [Nitrososphaerota archaeon]|nr:heavy-metal-associated domain-containing protein [Nitrososphaerota archaeon]MDG6965761.1 heavy-metal-associated domain-containing protein [Nitrososphaerota archaeon]MDG6982171.1 heavy-metal-associated domain-containing protein [Nitrososphaerota archaeon]